MLSRTYLLSIGGIATFALIAYYKKYRNNIKRKLPPKTEGLLSPMFGISSPQAPFYLLEQSRIHGPVYRVSFPFVNIYAMPDMFDTRSAFIFVFARSKFHL
jgi:hypothetical protein